MMKTGGRQIFCCWQVNNGIRGMKRLLKPLLFGRQNWHVADCGYSIIPGYKRVETTLATSSVCFVYAFMFRRLRLCGTVERYPFDSVVLL